MEELKRLGYDVTKSPLVSIIIPTYNSRAWLQECVESVLKQDILLERSARQGLLEVSFYDDGSNVRLYLFVCICAFGRTPRCVIESYDGVA